MKHAFSHNGLSKNELVADYGLHDPRTLEKSQELDAI
ncbi:aspartyl-phosphate phosphatase Spo0E family protein [Paenibacillus sp. AN1007]|uniref:Aspartyl-phosphate phosphatase Spo0E family protein n=1 Tax=Paenibacillus sp. AN1007 TaxID=3151385 RepID=A0AAU8NBA3_9BACL